MFGWKEFWMALPVIMFQAWCIYYLSCNGGRYYYNGSNVIKKIKDLIKKIWSKFRRNRTECLGVVFQLTMAALTSFLLKDTHIWTAIWIASIAIFAILYNSYKACVEMKRAQLTPTVISRNYLVLENQVIPIQTIYNVACNWNPRVVVIDTLSMDVENQNVAVSNVEEVVQRDLRIQSVEHANALVAHANAPEVTVQRYGKNRSVVADANVPEAATHRDVEDQFFACPPEVAKKDDEETQSIANANVPEIEIQRDVEDKSAAGQPEVAQKDDEENQSVADEYVTEVAIQRDVEDQSDAGPPETVQKDEEYQSSADANVREVAVHNNDVENQSFASADPPDVVHRDGVENQSYADADPLEVIRRDDVEHQSYADADPPELVHKDDAENQSYADNWY